MTERRISVLRMMDVRPRAMLSCIAVLLAGLFGFFAASAVSAAVDRTGLGQVGLAGNSDTGGMGREIPRVLPHRNGELVLRSGRVTVFERTVTTDKQPAPIPVATPFRTALATGDLAMPSVVTAGIARVPSSYLSQAPPQIVR